MAWRSDILSAAIYRSANVNQTVLVDAFLKPFNTMQHLTARRVLTDRFQGFDLSFVYVSVGALRGLPKLPSGVTFVVEYVDDFSLSDGPCFQYHHVLKLQVLRLPLDLREPVLFADADTVEHDIQSYLSPLKVNISNVVASRRGPVHLVDAAKHIDVVFPYDLQALVEGILVADGRVHIHNCVRMGSYNDRHAAFTPAFLSLSSRGVSGVDLYANRLLALNNTLFGSTPQLHALLLHLVRTRGKDENVKVVVGWCEYLDAMPLSDLTEAQQQTYKTTGVIAMKSAGFTPDPTT